MRIDQHIANPNGEKSATVVDVNAVYLKDGKGSPRRCNECTETRSHDRCKITSKGGAYDWVMASQYLLAQSIMGPAESSIAARLWGLGVTQPSPHQLVCIELHPPNPECNTTRGDGGDNNQFRQDQRNHRATPATNLKHGLHLAFPQTDG